MLALAGKGINGKADPRPLMDIVVVVVEYVRASRFQHIIDIHRNTRNAHTVLPKHVDIKELPYIMFVS